MYVWLIASVFVACDAAPANPVYSFLVPGRCEELNYYPMTAWEDITSVDECALACYLTDGCEMFNFIAVGKGPCYREEDKGGEGACPENEQRVVPSATNTYLMAKGREVPKFNPIAVDLVCAERSRSTSLKEVDTVLDCAYLCFVNADCRVFSYSLSEECTIEPLTCVDWIESKATTYELQGGASVTKPTQEAPSVSNRPTSFFGSPGGIIALIAVAVLILSVLAFFIFYCKKKRALRLHRERTASSGPMTPSGGVAARKTLPQLQARYTATGTDGLARSSGGRLQGTARRAGLERDARTLPEEVSQPDERRARRLPAVPEAPVRRIRPTLDDDTNVFSSDAPPGPSYDPPPPPPVSSAPGRPKNNLRPRVESKFLDAYAQLLFKSDDTLNRR